MSSITAAQVDPKVQLRQVVETIGVEFDAVDKALALVERLAPSFSRADCQSLKKRLVSYQKAPTKEQVLLAHGIRNVTRLLHDANKYQAVSDKSLEFLSSLRMMNNELLASMAVQMETAVIQGNVNKATQLMHLYDLDINALAMTGSFFTLVSKHQPNNLPLHLLGLAVGATPSSRSLVPLVEKVAGSAQWAPVLEAFYPMSHTDNYTTLQLSTQLPVMDILFDAGFTPLTQSLNDLQARSGSWFNGTGHATYAPALAFNGVDVEKTTLMARIPRMQIAVSIRNDFFAQRNLAVATYCQNAFPRVLAPLVMQYAIVTLDDVSFDARQKDENAVTLFKEMRLFCYTMLEARGLSFTQTNWEES
jgi:hypothetical protein